MFNSVEEARAYLPPQEVDCIVYHNACADGIISAFAGWKFHKGKNIQFVRGEYNKPFSVDQIPGKNVLIVDFSYKKDELEKLEQAGKKVLVLDHHEGALQKLKDYPHAFIVDEDTDLRAGAGLSWEYFFPDKPVPQLVQLVQDRDLWRFEFPESKPFGEALWKHLYACGFKTPFPFQQLEQYLQPYKMDEAIEQGKILYADMLKKIAPICQTATLRKYNDHTVWLVHVPNGTNRDEIGNALCDRGGADYAAIWWEESGGPAKYRVSFRSKKELDPTTKKLTLKVDVNPIANHFGGGGHKTAASCAISTHPESLFRAVPAQTLHVAYQQGNRAPSPSNNNANPLKRRYDKT